EDGIRVFHVTGVQTCALPIYTETGIPESMVREQQSITWYDLACRFVDLKWPHAAAKSRTGIADALATVTPVMVTTAKGKPDEKKIGRASCRERVESSTGGAAA